MFLMPSWFVLALLTVFAKVDPGSTGPGPKNSVKMGGDNPLTSHILDTSLGRPAKDVPITLFKLNEATKAWEYIMVKRTNEDGRVGELIVAPQWTAGVYKLHYDVEGYYKANNMDTFYPYAEVVFRVKNPHEHHHVPLLLNPYGYSTYRGS